MEGVHVAKGGVLVVRLNYRLCSPTQLATLENRELVVDWHTFSSAKKKQKAVFGVDIGLVLA